MKIQKLTPEEIQVALENRPGWTQADAKLRKTFEFEDFIHAFGFMSTAALGIEKMNHHPEWTNVYNRVTVDLSTHDSGGVTALDLELADLLDRVATRLQ